MALHPLNSIALCAGVGGLELGVGLAEPGAHAVAYVEREAYAAATLVARMEAGELAPAAVWSDLGTFDARPWRGVVDIVTSGDPCQPNSVAGKGLGADDDRFLIDQVCRIVDECRPDRLFRENVAGNADGQLAAIVPALESLGYRVAAGIFSAAEVGAGHKRERLFIMADANGGRHRPERQQCGRKQRLFAQDVGTGGAMDDPQRSERRPNGRSCPDHWIDGLPQWQESPDRIGASGAAMGNPADAVGRAEQQAQGTGAGGHDLQEQVQGWSTPRASDGEKGGPNQSFGAGGVPLAAQATSWPTPAARDHKGANSAEHVTTNGTGRKHMDQLANFVEHGFRSSHPAPATPPGRGYLEPIPFSPLPSEPSICGALRAEISVYRRWSTRSGGAAGWRGTWTRKPRRTLNARFVEWLMCWPLGWTGCAPVETGFTLWRQRSLTALSTLCTPPAPDQGRLL